MRKPSRLKCRATEHVPANGSQREVAAGAMRLTISDSLWRVETFEPMYRIKLSQRTDLQSDPVRRRH